LRFGDGFRVVVFNDKVDPTLKDNSQVTVLQFIT